MIQNTTITGLNRYHLCKTLNHVKQFHAYLVKINLQIDPFLSFLATSKDPPFFSYACLIFRHHSSRRNVFMYNSMIRGYLQMQSPSSAFLSYLDMLRDGIRANKYTFPPLIKAASMLSSNRKGLIGRLVHGQAVKLGVSNDLFVGSALIEFYAAVLDIGSAGKLFDEMPVRDVVLFTAMIDGYGKVGDVENARKVFDEMPERNAVSWSAIMAAYSRASDFREVLRLFRRMQESGMRPNESGLVSVLTACGHLGRLYKGFGFMFMQGDANMTLIPS